MGQPLASVDGVVVPLEQAVVPATDPAFLVGWAVFETLRSVDGEPHLLDAHLARLAESAAAALVPMPSAERLATCVRDLARAHGGAGRIRITLTGGGRCIVTVQDVETGRFGKPVRCVRGRHRDEPFLGGSIKHTSRAPWIVAVKRSGVDEVLLVDERGRFTEGTTCGILAVIDGALWAAPDDGRILASTTVVELLARAARLGIPVRREGPPADGLWDGLYVASTTRGLAPVVELDGARLPGWEPVGRRLVEEG